MANRNNREGSHRLRRPTPFAHLPRAFAPSDKLLMTAAPLLDCNSKRASINRMSILTDEIAGVNWKTVGSRQFAMQRLQFSLECLLEENYGSEERTAYCFQVAGN